jgi:hypothetical protein
MNDLTHDSVHAPESAGGFSVTDFAAGPVLLRGALAVERTDAGWLPRRLPLWTRAQYADQGIDEMAAQPSGVRLAFRTTADTVELDVLTWHAVWPADPVPVGAGTFDLVVDGVVRAAGRTEVAGEIELRDEAGAVALRRARRPPQGDRDMAAAPHSRVPGRAARRRADRAA